jgi:hypothetical protein
LSRYAETGSYKPGVNSRRQIKAETRQCQDDDDGVATEESDESKSKI